MRAAILLCCLAFALLGCHDDSAVGKRAAGSSVGESAVQQGWYSFENSAGRRDYFVQVPVSAASTSGHAVPLVVYLHGCSRPVNMAVASSGWGALARNQRFAVVFPEQTGAGCWAWSDPVHQHRDTGEPSIIIGITQEVMARFDIDPARVFIIGHSAGGYMANIMAVNYPEIYAALGILSGGPYGLGVGSEPDVSGRQSYEAMGAQPRVVPAFIAQSSTDQINPAASAELAVQQWLGLADHVDDGSLNGSVSRTPAQVENRVPEQTPRPGSDGCITTSNPCPGSAAGLQDRYPYSVMSYLDAGGQLLVEFWLVDGPLHNYAAGDDPLAPNLTERAYAFFSRHPMPGVVDESS